MSSWLPPDWSLELRWPPPLVPLHPRVLSGPSGSLTQPELVPPTPGLAPLLSLGSTRGAGSPFPPSLAPRGRSAPSHHSLSAISSQQHPHLSPSTMCTLTVNPRAAPQNAPQTVRGTCHCPRDNHELFKPMGPDRPGLHSMPLPSSSSPAQAHSFVRSDGELRAEPPRAPSPLQPGRPSPLQPGRPALSWE